MPEALLYNIKGEAMGKEKLPDDIFGVKVKPQVVHFAVVAQTANSRRNLAHTKTRGEVRGGGKKPWRQKGTGRARHGSIRSPIWRHGGVAFGPRKEKNFSLKINKRMKRSALLMSLSEKAQENHLYLLENLQFENKKTKSAHAAMTKMGISGSALVILPKSAKVYVRVFKNLPRVTTVAVNSLNVVDILRHRSLILTRDSLKELEAIYRPQR